MQMWKSILFRGQSVDVTNKRVWRRDATKYYYEIRHKDNNLSVPATIEDNVIVNFYGTLVSPVRIKLNKPRHLEGSYTTLTSRELVTIREAIENDGGDENGMSKM